METQSEPQPETQKQPNEQEELDNNINKLFFTLGLTCELDEQSEVINYKDPNPRRGYVKELCDLIEINLQKNNVLGVEKCVRRLNRIRNTHKSYLINSLKKLHILFLEYDLLEYANTILKWITNAFSRRLDNYHYDSSDSETEFEPDSESASPASGESTDSEFEEIDD